MCAGTASTHSPGPLGRGAGARRRGGRRHRAGAAPGVPASRGETSRLRPAPRTGQAPASPRPEVAAGGGRPGVGG